MTNRATYVKNNGSRTFTQLIEATLGDFGQQQDTEVLHYDRGAG